MIGEQYKDFDIILDMNLINKNHSLSIVILSGFYLLKSILLIVSHLMYLERFISYIQMKTL